MIYGLFLIVAPRVDTALAMPPLLSRYWTVWTPPSSQRGVGLTQPRAAHPPSPRHPPQSLSMLGPIPFLQHPIPLRMATGTGMDPTCNGTGAAAVTISTISPYLHSATSPCLTLTLTLTLTPMQSEAEGERAEKEVGGRYRRRSRNNPSPKQDDKGYGEMTTALAP